MREYGRHLLPWNNPPKDVLGLNREFAEDEQSIWLVERIRGYEYELGMRGESLSKYSIDELIELLNERWHEVLDKRKVVENE